MDRVIRVFVTAVAGMLLWGVAPLAQVQPRGAGEAAMRLYVLDGGVMKERDGVPYGLSREQMAPRDLSDFGVLIVHPRGILLWETGLNEAVNSIPAGAAGAAVGGPRPGDKVEKTLKRQLADAGYQPADVTYLAMSHAHWDHTGNVRDFLASTWLVQRAERDVMFGSTPLSNHADFAGLKDGRTRLLDGDHDVFGDGTVMLLSTPGHTAGHQALLVRLPKTGPVMLSGDLYHFPEELTLRPAPRGRNAEQIAASMKKVQEWLARTGAQLWIQHDIRGYAMLKKSPAYYD